MELLTASPLCVTAGAMKLLYVVTRVAVFAVDDTALLDHLPSPEKQQHRNHV